MATRQQLERALVNADAAGDDSAARQLAQALKNKQYDQPQDQIAESPQGFEPMQQEGHPQERGFLDRAGAMVGGAISGAQEMFTGERRTGADIERLPSLFESDLLADLPAAKKAKLVALAQITSDPEELAQIVTSQVPGTTIQYNRDEQGNVYPIVSDQQGRTAIVNKPGFDMLDASQFAADAAMFTPAGRIATLGRGVTGAATTAGVGAGAAAATEAGRQAVQASAGGEFDQMDVLMSGAFEGAGRLAESAGGAAFRGLTGSPSDEVADVIETGQRFNVPIATSDVVPPETAAGRAGRVMAESVPVVGTGGMRAEQQAARVRAVDEFMEQFQGGSFEDVVDALKRQKEAFKREAGKVYSNVTPKLDEAAEASGGIPFPETNKEIEKVREFFSDPAVETSDAARDLLNRIEEKVKGTRQNFSTIKSNTSTWAEEIQSLNPTRPLGGNEKRLLSRLNAAVRTDRDAFARANLEESAFRRLKDADAAYGEMSNELKKSRLKNVLEQGDVVPERARDLLRSAKPSEVAMMAKSLDEEGKASARAAMMTDIAESLGQKQGGAGFTPDALASELAKRKPFIDEFFSGAKRKELTGFVRMLNATREAQRALAAQSVPTGERAIPWIALLGGYYDPNIVGAYGTIGALGRLYETPRVRTIMSRMASVTPGSTRFEQLVQQFRQEAARFGQGLINEELPENLTGEEDEPNQNQ